MNFILRFTLSVTTLLFLAISSAYAIEDSPVLNRIKESGKLTVGTSGTIEAVAALMRNRSLITAAQLTFPIFEAAR